MLEALERVGGVAIHRRGDRTQQWGKEIGATRDLSRQRGKGAGLSGLSQGGREAKGPFAET